MKFFTKIGIYAILAVLSATPTRSLAEGVVYYHTDALGSPVATTDATGAVIRRNDYEPFGRVLNQPPSDGPGYTGHVLDSQTTLSYMQQRYYDPSIGLFLSADPVIAFDTSDWRQINRYSYAFNNPYRFTDPDGRCPICIPILAGIFVYFTSGPANAPAPGERTSAMPAGQQLASAIPGGGRAVATGKMMASAAGKLSQRAANREAKRQAGIPTSQQPSSQTNGRAPDGTQVGRQQSYEVPKSGGGTETKSVQVSRDTRGDHAGQPQIEAGTVKPGGQVDIAGRPRIQNEDKIRVDFERKR